MSVRLSMNVNGKPVTADVASRTLLVDFLRDQLRLTGTHIGCDTAQCGYCTPGMVMTAIDLVNNDPEPDDAKIREGLDGNLCRCTGYHNIVKAVHAGAAAMKK